MISEYKKSESSKILYVINDAAIKYKGVIPDNCWHEPYMSEQELINEFSDGVRMYGYHQNDKLIGTGSELLKYLLKKNQNSRLLVGTWRDATWAIRFYEKFGFILHAKDQTTLLLKKYWKISSNQIKNSVVLERQLGSN